MVVIKKAPGRNPNAEEEQIERHPTNIYAVPAAVEGSHESTATAAPRPATADVEGPHESSTRHLSPVDEDEPTGVFPVVQEGPQAAVNPEQASPSRGMVLEVKVSDAGYRRLLRALEASPEIAGYRVLGVSRARAKSRSLAGYRRYSGEDFFAPKQVASQDLRWVIVLLYLFVGFLLWLFGVVG